MHELKPQVVRVSGLLRHEERHRAAAGRAEWHAARVELELPGHEPQAKGDHPDVPFVGAAKAQAVTLLEQWRGRPINFFFLRHLLEDMGLWDALSKEKGFSGLTAEESNTKAAFQTVEHGELTDF